jgi:hypothetical protein
MTLQWHELIKLMINGGDSLAKGELIRLTDEQWIVALTNEERLNSRADGMRGVHVSAQSDAPACHRRSDTPSHPPLRNNKVLDGHFA